MILQCGRCQSGVPFGETDRVVICGHCQAVLSKPGVPIAETLAVMRNAGMLPVRVDAPPPFPPFDTRQIRAFASEAFGRLADEATPQEFYATWRAYDSALQGMQAGQQGFQRGAELLELERQFAL